MTKRIFDFWCVGDTGNQERKLLMCSQTAAKIHQRTARNPPENHHHTRMLAECCQNATRLWLHCQKTARFVVAAGSPFSGGKLTENMSAGPKVFLTDFWQISSRLLAIFLPFLMAKQIKKDIFKHSHTPRNFIK